MAYNELLADRMNQSLKELGAYFFEKKMFGGIAFMVNNKLCVGVIKNSMMIRVDPETIADELKKPGCKIMDFTGRPMKGYLLIEPEGYDMDEDLEYWIKQALAFNPKANASKKKQ